MSAERVLLAATGSSHELSTFGDGSVIIKRYRFTERDQHGREWRALHLLNRYAPGLAPEPITATLNASPPLITMRRLVGDPLGGSPVTEVQVAAVVAALDRLHSCVPAAVLRALPSAGNDPRVAASPLQRKLSAQPRPSADPVVAAAYDAGLRWFDSIEAVHLRDDEPRPVLARGDHNLPNFLWDGTAMTLVDFEHSGRGDRCSELADMVEHISARNTPDATWQALLDACDLTRAEVHRLHAARRLAAIMWLLLLLPGQAGHERNPPGALRAQADRLLAMGEA